jgi:opacity protein-like surface antigen
MKSMLRCGPSSALAGLLGGLMLVAPPASAQAPATTSDSWAITASPYVWFSGLSGDISVPAGSVSFSADFGDIFETLKFSAMGIVEARRGNFSIVSDALYLNLQQGIPVPGSHGAFSGGSARTQSAEISVIGLYTLAETPSGRFELGGGVRAWWFNTAINYNSGLLPGRSADSSTSWADPILAARGIVRLSESLSFTAYGDVGGFGVGTEFTWQAMGTLDWRLRDNLSVSIGYRYMHLDYEKGRATIGVDLSGPIIGASYRF